MEHINIYYNEMSTFEFDISNFYIELTKRFEVINIGKNKEKLEKIINDHLSKSIKHKVNPKDIADVEIYLTCLEHKVDVLITDNVKDFENFYSNYYIYFSGDVNIKMVPIVKYSKNINIERDLFLALNAGLNYWEGQAFYVNKFIKNNFKPKNINLPDFIKLDNMELLNIIDIFGENTNSISKIKILKGEIWYNPENHGKIVFSLIAKIFFDDFDVANLEKQFIVKKFKYSKSNNTVSFCLIEETKWLKLKNNSLFIDYNILYYISLTKSSSSNKGYPLNMFQDIKTTRKDLHIYDYPSLEKSTLIEEKIQRKKFKIKNEAIQFSSLNMGFFNKREIALIQLQNGRELINDGYNAWIIEKDGFMKKNNSESPNIFHFIKNKGDWEQVIDISDYNYITVSFGKKNIKTIG